MLEGKPGDYADGVEPAKARVDQANTLSLQWREKYNLLTSLFERADAECRSTFSFAAVCQTRDRYQLQREEAAFNQRKAEEIGRRLEKEYKDRVHDRDEWARAYRECKELEKRVGPCPDRKVIENQERKCNNLEAIAQQFRSGRASGSTAPPPPTKTTQTTTKLPAPTGRTVKIGCVNYQKLPNFTVTVNGTSQSCSSGFDTSRPYRKGEGDCSFDVPAGQCRISVHASGYITQSFQHTCDRDETMMATLSKAP